jgi:hypothetical protein
MKKIATALTLIIIAITSTLTTSLAYLAMVNPARQESQSSPTSSTASVPSPSSVTPNQENNSSSTSPSQPAPSPSAPYSSAPAPTPTPAPTPLADSSYPEGIEEWLPLGTFGIVSPTNQTYNTNSLFLNVSGVIVAGSPSLSYSLDEGPRTPITLELKKLTMIQVSISGSVALPPLANGSHVIVLYGDLSIESRRGKVMVYFDIAGI